MNVQAENTAKRVAANLQEVGFIGTIASIFSIVYGIYQFWSICHGNAATAATEVSGHFDSNNNSFSRHLHKRASIGVRKATRRQGHHYCDADIDVLTEQCLLGIIHTDDDQVAVACSHLIEESPMQEDQVSAIFESVLAECPAELAPEVMAAVAGFSPKEIADILGQFIDSAPKIIAAVQVAGPFTALLPKPFNLLANPAVAAAIMTLPALLPYLVKIREQLLLI